MGMLLLRELSSSMEGRFTHTHPRQLATFILELSMSNLTVFLSQGLLLLKDS